MKRTILLMSLLMSLLLIVASCGNNSGKNNNDKQQSIESVYSALQNGHIHWGMTYKEIAAVCGPANSFFDGEEPGEILTAYYKPNYALDFENGKFCVLRYANGGLIEKDPNF